MQIDGGSQGVGQCFRRPRPLGQADDLAVQVIELVRSTVIIRTSAHQIAKFIKEGGVLNPGLMLQLIEQSHDDAFCPLDVLALRQQNVGHALRIGSDYLAFGRFFCGAYLAAYRFGAYQLLGLGLDAFGKVTRPVIALCPLAYCALGDVVLGRYLAQALDARPIVQLDALPIGRGGSLRLAVVRGRLLCDWRVVGLSHAASVATDGKCVQPYMEQSKTMAKHSIHVPDAIENIIAIPEGSAESYSGRLSYLVTMADTLAREQMPELTVGEWGAIVDANMSTLHQYSMGIQSVLSGLWHNLFDFAKEGNEKWGVDCVALARRMQSMPLGAQAAVFEVIKQFWHRTDDVNEAGGYTEAFRLLGARLG